MPIIDFANHYYPPFKIATSFVYVECAVEKLTDEDGTHDITIRAITPS